MATSDWGFSLLATAFLMDRVPLVFLGIDDLLVVEAAVLDVMDRRLFCLVAVERLVPLYAVEEEEERCFSAFERRFSQSGR